MANDSTALGFLSPTVSPTYGDALDDLLHDAINGITGVANDLIRPRWQPEPPTQPPFTTDWVAFGIVRCPEDVFAYEAHDPSGNGTILQRDEEPEVLISFYGPNSALLQKTFSSGISMAQNRDTLAAVGIKLIEVQEPYVLPSLLKEKWVRRVDITIRFRRRIGWTYNIQNLLQGGSVGLNNEQYTTPIIIS